MGLNTKTLLAIGVAACGMGAVLAAPANAQSENANPRAGEKIAGSYICVFNDSDIARANVPGEARRLANANGGTVKNVYTRALKGFATNMSAQAVDRMARMSPNIAYCEQDQVVSIDQGRGRPGGGGGDDGGSQPAQSTPWGIARVNGGGSGTFKTAWVIDSGIDLDHPDLNVDTARSASFLRKGGPDDQNGHGTHVAGTIGARDNAIGVIGVAPGASVVAVRVLDRRGSGSTSGVIAGVDYVAANGSAGDVANMSLGGGTSSALDTAVLNASNTGVRFVLAAGNEAQNANNSSPARTNGPNVYTISAFADGDTFASFSNFGNPPVDYAEPGVAINSTWLEGGYRSISGTSMAAPHFAGILLHGNPGTDGVVSGDRDSNPDVIGVVN